MLPVFGLHTHIAANRRRSAFLIAGLFLLFYLMAFGLALLLQVWSDDGSVAAGIIIHEGNSHAIDTTIHEDNFGSFEAILRAGLRDMLWLAPITTVLVAIWIWCGFRFNEFILNLTTGSSAIARQDDPGLYNLLQNLCISRGLTMPKLRILETSAPNAFASGLRPDQYTITVTRGLLNRLNERELEAVLAHELTHIRNGDVRTMMIAVLVVGIMSFVGEMIYRWLADGPSVRRSSDKRSHNSGSGGRFAAILVAIVCIVVAWILSQVVRFSLSRHREFLADAGAVELTHNADAMISALTKIKGKGELEGVPSAVMELCLDNPRSGFDDLFATHPSIDERIDALVLYAGGCSSDGQGDPTAAPSSAELSAKSH